MAVAALILGIVSIALPWVLCFLPVPFVSNAIALVAGIVAIVLANKGKKTEPEKKGMYTAALVLGIIGVVFQGISIVLAALALAALGALVGGAGGLQGMADSFSDAIKDPEVQKGLQEMSDGLKTMTEATLQ